MKCLAEPVLTNLSSGCLKQLMPAEAAPGAADDRRKYTHLEALGRLMCGIAPWLQVRLPAGPEADLQKRYVALAQQAIRAAVDPQSPDYMRFDVGPQCLVDAAFLAQAILRARQVLWELLDPAVQDHLVAALQSTRSILPPFNNWLLFSGIIEATLCAIGAEWDHLRIDYALRQMEQWYKGDGVYGDGPEFHWDYYNSFVIHPMLIDILQAVARETQGFTGNKTSAEQFPWSPLFDRVLARARRYAEILERMIAPDGSFPPIGRSLAYRFGVFHLLGQLVLQHQLPPSLTPGQVRSALTAVIRRMSEAPGTFDNQGWLTIGFCGHQPGVGERYISTGSLYLCAAGLLPLGLPPEDEFWQAEPQDWTARKLWAEQDIPPDHALGAH
ncbi:MAG: DUF2264 domain-containing protein [Anaerolineae bacterium]|nr:DUF2264 domain-containing protein [Anaerolineae bacterium]